jgi:hypothetical protein
MRIFWISNPQNENESESETESDGGAARGIVNDDENAP